MGYVRGNRGDYDKWAQSGLDGWSYDEVLPYFMKQETWEGGASAYRGGSGPLTVRTTRYADPLLDACIDAGAALGHRRFIDYNGAEQEGMGPLQSTIRDGLRCSSADAYLRPALSRSNLAVVTHAYAERVVFDGETATGVQYRHAGRLTTALASKEVILCGGVINSPHLLMLSGIGAADELREHGISVKVDLPGVGKNFQDHVNSPLPFVRKTPGPLHHFMRLDRVVKELGKAYFFGNGFATDLPGPLTAFLRTSPELEMPDIQILSNFGPMNTGPYLSPFKKPYQDGFALVVVLLRPESRGHLKLASANPSQPIKIHQNFLARQADRITLRKGVRMVREITRQSALGRFIDRPMALEGNQISDSDIDAHIQARSITSHHPLGSCKMGTANDPLAVVDAELRVRGVKNLRVVDASVMPNLIGGNINAPVMMIAERTADLIRKRPLLVPQQSGQHAEAAQ
jgi:4-pyridoxate dehydrogenase